MVDGNSDVNKEIDVTDIQFCNEEATISYDQWKGSDSESKYLNINSCQSSEIVVLDVGGRKFYALASIFSTWSKWSNTR